MTKKVSRTALVEYRDTIGDKTATLLPPITWSGRTEMENPESEL